MKFYVSLRTAIRYLVTSLVVLTLILLINFIQLSNKRLASVKTYQLVDVKHLQSQCPEQLESTSNETWESKRLRYEMHDICACPRAKRPLSVGLYDGENIVLSSCDAQATARGFNQTVVSFTFYGSVHGIYFEGIERNAKWVSQMYPGYVMRVYHNLHLVEDNVTSKALCDLWCYNEHLDFCNVKHLPDDLCDQTPFHARMWRFLVLGDPLVDRFLVRDIDSEIIQREVDAVQEWISEGKTWHIMRDHPYHSNKMLAGMWGGTNRNLTMTTALRKLFLTAKSNEGNRDQYLLKTILWPMIQNDMLAHDSYTCKLFPDTKPWPTKRKTIDFVGDKFPWHNSHPFALKSECPVECRPKDHQDWIYC